MERTMEQCQHDISRERVPPPNPRSQSSIVTRGSNMKRRAILWGFVGFIVGGCWVLLSLATPLSMDPILWSLARLTCPIAPISMALHFGVKWYWVPLTNFPAYALVGFGVEALRHSRNALLRHGRERTC